MKPNWVYIISVAPFLLEILLRALGSDDVFWGIPITTPPFRDFYVLHFNALCDIPIWNFSISGSCSDDFYGVPRGSFDYPLPIFYVARAVRFIFSSASPSVLAAILAASFIIALSALVFKQKIKQYQKLLVVFLLLSSYPVRYALERGQLDLIVWTLSILSCIFLSPMGIKRQTTISYPTHSLPSFLVPFFLFLGSLIKVFTYPALLIYTLKSLGYRSSRRLKLINASMIVMAPILILMPFSGLPGENNTRLSSMPGEVFGLMTSINIESPLFLVILKIVFTLLGLFFSINLFRSTSSLIIDHPRMSNPLSLLATIGSSSYILFYLLSVSANYKLISAIIFLGSISLYSLSSQSLSNNSFSSIQNLRDLNACATSPALEQKKLLLLISMPMLFVIATFGYRPYLPSLQFLSQSFIDFIVMPMLFGLCLSHLFQTMNIRITGMWLSRLLRS